MQKRSSKSSFKISQLARLAGVTVRTVRYYLAQGLIPSPSKTGRYAEYQQRHLDRLRLIVRLKESFLPLDEIGNRLQQLSDDEVGLLLSSWKGPDPNKGDSSAASKDDAAAYLSRIRASQKDLDQATERFVSRRSANVYFAADLDLDPTEETGLRSDPSSMSSSDHESVRLDKTDASDLDLELSSSVSLNFAAKSFVPRDLEDPDTPIQTGSTWNRFVIAPGIELHIDEKALDANRTVLSEFIKTAKEIFG